MVRRHCDVGIAGCMTEVLVHSTSWPANAGKVSPASTRALISCQKMGCHCQQRARGKGRWMRMRRQGEWETRGSDSGSSGKIWQTVQFELAQPTHLSAAGRHSRPKSCRVREIGLSHQLHSPAVSCIASCNAWQSLICLVLSLVFPYKSSCGLSLSKRISYNFLLLICSCFALNLLLSVKGLDPACWCVDKQAISTLSSLCRPRRLSQHAAQPF